MNSRAFHLSIEAIFSLLVLALLLSMPLPAADAGLERLQLLQKQQDLLAVWLVGGDFGSAEMKSDFEFVFAGRAGIIEFAREKLEIGVPPDGCAVSTAGVHYLDSAMKLQEITLTVFC